MGKHSKRSDYINPTYANKEKRTALGDKSLEAFGSRGKWLKLANKTGLNIEEVEEQMDMVIEQIRIYKEETLKKQLEKKEK